MGEYFVSIGWIVYRADGTCNVCNDFGDLAYILISFVLLNNYKLEQNLNEKHKKSTQIYGIQFITCILSLAISKKT